MRISLNRLRRILFGTSCAVVFGFGASQALASPAQAAFYGCTVWQDMQCQNYCAGLGAQGRCTNFGIYDCQCYFGPNIGIDP